MIETAEKIKDEKMPNNHRKEDFVYDSVSLHSFVLSDSPNTRVSGYASFRCSDSNPLTSFGNFRYPLSVGRHCRG